MTTGRITQVTIVLGFLFLLFFEINQKKVVKKHPYESQKAKMIAYFPLCAGVNFFVLV